MRGRKIIMRQLVACFCTLICVHASGISLTRLSLGSGSWSNSSTWSPAGLPSPTDNIVIASGNTIIVDMNVSINQLTVNSGGLLSLRANQTLTINGAFTVNGVVKMNGGDITLPYLNTPFTI